MILFSSGDWMAFAGCVLGLGGLVGSGEALRRWGWGLSGIRRLVHMGVGLVVAGTPWLFTSPAPVYLLAGIFVGINATARWRRWWPGVHAARPESWGTVAMPLVLIPTLAATWTVGADRVFILSIAFLILALADPLASWVGAAWGRRVWVAEATVTGSITFLVVALVVTGAGLSVGADWTFQRVGFGALLVAIVATGSEALSRRGWDNVFVVLSVVLVLVPLHETPDAMGQIGLGLLTGAVFGLGAYATRTLTAAGAVGGGLFAASLVGLGGWAWALPGFVFFVLASALSFVDEKRSPAEPEPVEARGRRLRQVLANGGVAWLLLAVYVVFPSNAGQLQVSCYAGFLGALAAAAADTWATEIGVFSSSRPWSLRTGRRVEAGTSGAVSVAGTVGAVLGAASVAVAALLAGETVDPIGWGTIARIVGAGLVGMLVDSLVGALVQARYRDPTTGRFVEHLPEPNATPVQGWSKVDNEVVNGLATTAGALAAVLLWW